MEYPLVANWNLSRDPSRYDKMCFKMKSSMILDTWDVSAIGRRSLSIEDGSGHLGMGEMMHTVSAKKGEHHRS